MNTLVPYKFSIQVKKGVAHFMNIFAKYGIDNKGVLLQCRKLTHVCNIPCQRQTCRSVTQTFNLVSRI